MRYFLSIILGLTMLSSTLGVLSIEVVKAENPTPANVSIPGTITVVDAPIESIAADASVCHSNLGLISIFTQPADCFEIHLAAKPNLPKVAVVDSQVTSTVVVNSSVAFNNHVNLPESPVKESTGAMPFALNVMPVEQSYAIRIQRTPNIALYIKPVKLTELQIMRC